MPDYDEYDLKNKFVFGDDGHTIWIKDFFMGKQTGWAKGELKNNKITIEAGQYVGDSGKDQLYLSRLPLMTTIMLCFLRALIL